MKRLLAMLLMAAMLLSMTAVAVGEDAIDNGCAHARKVQVTEAQEPVYVNLGEEGHRVAIDTMIYWECRMSKQEAVSTRGSLLKWAMTGLAQARQHRRNTFL